MNTLSERLVWARQQKTQREGVDFTQEMLANQAGVSQGSIGHLESGRTKTSRKIAALATALGVDSLWLAEGRGEPDMSTVYGVAEQVRDVYEIGHVQSGRNEPTNGDVDIPQYQEKGGAMGHGVLLRDQPGEIHGWRVTPDWIAKNVKTHTGIGNLAIVTGFGDSMRGMFNPGDPLLVDRGITSVEFDGVYFFRVGEEGFIKRLQRVPGEGLVAISENKAYRDWIVRPDMDFQVFARVLKVWIGTDF